MQNLIVLYVMFRETLTLQIRGGNGVLKKRLQFSIDSCCVWATKHIQIESVVIFLAEVWILVTANLTPLLLSY